MVRSSGGCLFSALVCFFFQAEDGIRDAQESRGLGDVYKRQALSPTTGHVPIYYSPVRHSSASEDLLPFDLHV